MTDDVVAPFWLESVCASLDAGGVDAHPVVFPAGEASKCVETWRTITDSMVEARMGRDSCVVSLGGGVVGDLSGFVAATYMRGLPWLQVPTSTLAMIDASVGGKTGVDHPGGKNLVGAFHPPRAVLIDADFLATLPVRLRAHGFAEAVKHGLVLDRDYFADLIRAAPDLLTAEPTATSAAVARSVALKAEVVSEDEFERGRRRILNFGHTIAHALEAATAFQVPHGEAVAVGMVAEARIGESMGITEKGTSDQIADALADFKLPTHHPALADVDSLLAFTASDKKMRTGQMHLVALDRVGQVHQGESWSVTVTRAQLAELMAEL